MHLSTLQILTKSVENIWYMIYFVLFINYYMYNSSNNTANNRTEAPPSHSKTPSENAFIHNMMSGLHGESLDRQQNASTCVVSDTHLLWPLYQTYVLCLDNLTSRLTVYILLPLSVQSDTDN